VSRPIARRGRRAAALALALLLALVVGACSGGAEPAPGGTPSSSAASTGPDSTEDTASSDDRTEPDSAGDLEPPQRWACYDLTYDEALAPTSDRDPVPCASRHTAVTYAVGELDAVVAGHLLAVDSARVRRQVATVCPDTFARFVGGSEDDRRLSMLRPVWFTPTVEQSDLGASWYRCDVTLLAGDGELGAVSGRMRGVLDRPEARERYALCGTAAPGSSDFARVPCSAEHRWRAVDVVSFEARTYPGVEAVRAAGEQPCQNAGASASGGSLDYEWGYEWPTAEQWRAGQTYGICWARAAD